MKEEWLRKAARGMGNRQNNEEATNLLLAAGTETLKRFAGYLPPETEAGLPKRVFQPERALINAKAREHLGTILADTDYHFVLPEWAIRVTALNLAVPPEWMPVLLNLGATNETLRPYLMLLMDKRSFYLVDSADNWDWLLKQRLLQLDEFLALHQRDALELERGLRNMVEGINVHSTMVTMARLAAIPPPWTEDLSDAFMSFLRHQIYRNRLINFLSPFLPNVLKFLPLEYTENFMIIMDNNFEANFWWQNNRDYIERILAFRFAIIQALAK